METLEPRNVVTILESALAVFEEVRSTIVREQQHMCAVHAQLQGSDRRGSLAQYTLAQYTYAMVNTRSVRQHDTASPDLEQSMLSLVGAGGGAPCTCPQNLAQRCMEVVEVNTEEVRLAGF